MLPTTAIDPGTTGITSFRQKDRTLATASTTIRDVDDVSSKPETDSETELLTATMKQIANVETSVPNVLIENRQFAPFIETDLRLGWNEGVDYMVTTAILASTPSVASGGSNAVEVVFHAPRTSEGPAITRTRS